MKSRALDLILAAVIVLSGGFIGYRLLVKKEPVTAAAIGVEPQTKLAGDVAPGFIRPAIPQNVPFGFGQRMALKIKVQTKEEWEKAVAAGNATRYLVDQTDACKNPVAPVLYAYTLLMPDVAAQVTKGTIKVLPDGLGRTCIKRGALLPLVFYSFMAEEPAMKVIGNITIADILQVPFNEMTEPLAQAFGMTLKEFRDFNAGPALAGSGKISFLRFNKLEESVVDKNRPVRAFPRTPLVFPAALQNWLQAHPRTTIIDVRSKEESTQLPLNFKGNIISAPYMPKDGKTSFRWDKTVNEINSDKQDIEPILSATKNQEIDPIDLLVVGSAPEDGRATWALYNILTLRLDHVYWYYEGAASFNQALGTTPPMGGSQQAK